MKLPFEEHGLGGRTEAEKKDEKGPESRAAYPSLLDRLRLLSSLPDQSGLPAFGTLEGSTGGLLERTRRNGGKGHPCPKGNVLEGLPSDSSLVQVDSLAPSSPVRYLEGSNTQLFTFTLRPARVRLASFESLSFLCKFATEAQPDFPWFAARVSLAYGLCPKFEILKRLCFPRLPPVSSLKHSLQVVVQRQD